MIAAKESGAGGAIQRREEVTLAESVSPSSRHSGDVNAYCDTLLVEITELMARHDSLWKSHGRAGARCRNIRRLQRISPEAALTPGLHAELKAKAALKVRLGFEIVGVTAALGRAIEELETHLGKARPPTSRDEGLNHQTQQIETAP